MLGQKEIDCALDSSDFGVLSLEQFISPPALLFLSCIIMEHLLWYAHSLARERHPKTQIELESLRSDLIQYFTIN